MAAMPIEMPSDGVVAVPPALAPAPEEVFGTSTMAQMLVGKTDHNRRDFLQQVQNKVAQAIQSPEGKKEVQRMLQCIRAYCFQGPSATMASVKSGLTTIGAVAIGLDSKVGDFLEDIMQLLLGDPLGSGPFLAEPSSDQVSGDARVRYLACESLFNVAKVANEELLPYLDRIFDGLSRLAGDVVPDVRHAAQVLDRLLKDITSHHQDKLNVGSFVDELAKRMKFKNPMIRQLCLGWTSLVLSMENVDLESFIPRFLEGIFEVMETHDHSRDSRQNADTLLDKCLEKVKNLERPKARRIIFQTAQRLAQSCKNQDKVIRLCSLCWLYEYVKLTPNFAGAACAASSASSAFALRETDEGEAMAWHNGWSQRLPDVMDGVFDCIGDKETEVSQMAVDLNNSLLELSGSLGDGLPVTELVTKLRDRLRPPPPGRQLGAPAAATGSEDPTGLVVVQVACLQWICLLLADSPQQMLQKETMKELFMPIFENLMHPHDQVVIASLRVMAQIMEAHPVEELTIEDFFQDRCVDTFTAPRAPGPVDLFTKIVERLLLVFSSEREMLESRGRLMIRQLCGHLDPRRLYVTVARAIQQEPNKDFAQKLVQTFNWILLTAAETRQLREELLEESQSHPQLLQLASLPNSTSGTGAKEVKPLFLELLEPWFHNPASALALCLWSQQYDLASELTARFASFDPTLEFLQQLDQLVMLIESPIFSRLRLRLLEPRQHPSLLKCLLGLAMLLPQAGAFQALTERMQLVQSSLLLEAREAAPKSGDWWGQDKRTLELKALLETFDKISHA